MELPERIAHVLPAGPPAAIIIYMLAPDRLLGWTRAPSAAERAFLPPRYAGLPEVGRLTGRGNTSSVEAIVRLAPDLVLDIGSTTATYVSLADRVQQQTRIPDVLIDRKLANAALFFVSRQEAPFGIVYETDAAADKGMRIVAAFPENTHPPIVYPIALTGDAGFLRFLESPAAKPIFEKQGFEVLP